VEAKGTDVAPPIQSFAEMKLGKLPLHVLNVENLSRTARII
jgi:hypothetical protein